MKEYLRSLFFVTKSGQINIKKSMISKEMMDQIFLLTDKCDGNLSERIYWVLNDMTDYPSCKECGKTFKPRFYGFKYAYRDSLFCSNKCAANNSLIKDKTKNTLLDRYGVEYAQQSAEINQKSKDTLFKNYGVKTNRSIKYNRFKTLEKEPLECFYNREQLKQLIEEKTKVSNINEFSDNEIKSIIYYTQNCRKQSFSERVFWILNDIEDYPNCIECGTKWKPRYSGLSTKSFNELRFCSNKCSANNKEVQRKQKHTYKEKTGYDCGFQSPKTKQTILERYGVENVFQSEEIKEKIKQTNLQRYGVEFISQSQQNPEKVKRTNIERYGVENVFQSEEIKEKIKQTNLQRYGVENVSHNEEIHIKQNKVRNKILVLPSGKEVLYQRI